MVDFAAIFPLILHDDVFFADIFFVQLSSTKNIIHRRVYACVLSMVSILFSKFFNEVSVK